MTEKNEEDHIPDAAKMVTLPAPDWHDRPTCPGLWVVCADEMEVMRVKDMSIANSFVPHGSRVYGPIPPDPKSTSKKS